MKQFYSKELLDSVKDSNVSIADKPIHNTNVQLPIGDENHYGRTTYIYACNGCGKDVSGYNHSKVYGFVWCAECRKNRGKIYSTNQYEKGRRETIDYLVQNGYIKYGFDMDYLIKQMEKNRDGSM